MAEHDDRNEAVRIGPRIVAGSGFDTLYREGMGLVEEVAAYLDGPGRSESRALPRNVSVVYATESMRLTTRLMQLASWLLLQRAVREGELTALEAESEKHKVSFRAGPMAERSAEWDLLPEQLLQLIERGDRLYARVSRLAKMERDDGRTAEAAEPSPHSVASQFARLQAAFGQKA